MAKILKVSLVAFAILFSTRDLTYFFSNKIYYLAEGIFLVFLVGFAIFYVISGIIARRKFHPLEVLTLIYLFFPIQGAIGSMLEFGQPLHLGILTNRYAFLIITAVFVYYLLWKKVITIYELKYGILGIAWVSIVIYYLLIIFMDPEQYFSAQMIEQNEAKGGIVYRFPATFVIVAIVYYFTKFISQKKFNDLVYGSIFGVFLVFFLKGRGAIIAVGVTIVIYFLRHSSIKSIYKGFLIFSGLALIGLITVQIFNIDLSDTFISSFANIFKVLTGHEANEYSADARLAQTTIALNHFGNSLFSIFFGVGQLSQQWPGNVYADLHFYPTDIGIIGVLFSFGVFGLLISKYQYVLVWRFLQFVRKRSPKDIFLHALAYSSLALFISSIQTGVDIFMPALNFLVLYIAFFYKMKFQTAYAR